MHVFWMDSMVQGFNNNDTEYSIINVEVFVHKASPSRCSKTWKFKELWRALVKVRVGILHDSRR